MKKLILLVIAVPLFIRSPVIAENYKAYVNGRDLIERCDTENSGTMTKFIFPNCMGYIAATIDTHENLVRAGGSKPLFCKPAGRFHLHIPGMDRYNLAYELLIDSAFAEKRPDAHFAQRSSLNRVSEELFCKCPVLYKTPVLKITNGSFRLLMDKTFLIKPLDHLTTAS